MPATEPNAFVYLTDSAGWFKNTELGKQLISPVEWDTQGRGPGYLQVMSYSVDEGWLKCSAILKEPADPEKDLVEVMLPAHAVSAAVSLDPL